MPWSQNGNRSVAEIYTILPSKQWESSPPQMSLSSNQIVVISVFSTKYIFSLVQVSFSIFLTLSLLSLFFFLVYMDLVIELHFYIVVASIQYQQYVFKHH